MKQRFDAFLGLCALLGAAGCGNDASASGETDQSGSQRASVVAPEDVAEPTANTAEVAATGGDVTVASVSPAASGTSAAGSSVPAARSRASTLGYNMDFPGDWTNLPPFIDLMKNARAPVGECAESGCDPVANLQLDAQGWLKSLGPYRAVRMILNTSNERPDIGQTFVVTWQGTGEVGIENGAEVQPDNAGKRLTFRLQTGPTSLVIRAIDAADPLRNVRVFRADQEALLAQGEIFNPDMLSYLAPFGSVRFMDWMQSNAEGICSGGSRSGQSCYAVTNPDCGGGTCIMPGVWDERPRAEQSSLRATEQFLNPAQPARGTRRGGYPVETMVALANRLGASPHFNMPVHYQDDYVKNFAEYVRDNLAPGLVASVEYSNEVWNWGFPQAQYANTLGGERWPGEGSAWVQFSAVRTDNMCRIWKEAFAGQEERLRCLISPQTSWRDIAEDVLECPARSKTEPGAGPCYQHVDAINITGYFSGCMHENAGTIQGWLAAGKASALDKGFEQLNHGGLIAGCTDSLDRTIDTYSYFKGLAEARGLGLYVYESGTHFEYSGAEEVRQFFVDMTQDPRMYDAYERNFEGFRAAGGSTFNVWGWVAQDDAWANSESLLDREHPKYRAISDFVAAEEAAAQ